jgi:hypothetical protein
MDPRSLELLADRLLEAEMTRLPIDVPSLPTRT